MKLRTLLAFATLGLASQLQAFTLDFALLTTGTTFSPAVDFQFLEYGTVRVSAGTSVDVAPVDGSNALLMNEGEILTVEFLNGPQSLVNVDYADYQAGPESLVGFTSDGGNTYQFHLSGAGAEAGIRSIEFGPTSVPEPTAAALGLVGVAGIVLRRRR